MSQQIQQQLQAQPTGGNYDSRLGTLEYAVSGFAARLDSIDRKLDNQGKVPWGALIASALGAVTLVVTLVSGIGALAFSPLSAGIADVKAAVVKFEGKTESFMKREDIEAQIIALRSAFREQFDIAKERRNDLQAKTDDRIARGEKDVAAIQAQVVPRGEHEQTWAGQRAMDAGLQRQIDELRKGLGDLNTPRDTIQGMQRRIDELERMRWEASTRR